MSINENLFLKSIQVEQSKNHEEIEYKDLLDSYQIIAKVVATYGETYLPIFERMHQELETAKQKQLLKELAYSVANDDKFLSD